MNKDFDLILSNPPYQSSTHAKIAKNLLKYTGRLVVLAPTSQLNGNSANCIELRNTTKLADYRHEGIIDFGLAKPDVSIYVYDKDQPQLEWNEVFLNQLNPLEKSIRNKISKVRTLNKEWMIMNLTKRVKADGYTVELDWMRDRMNAGEYFVNFSVFNNSKADGIILREPMMYAGSWYGPKELIEELKKPLYKQLAKMYSTNKRDQQALCLSHLPQNLDDVGLTNEEVEYLLSL